MMLRREWLVSILVMLGLSKVFPSLLAYEQRLQRPLLREARNGNEHETVMVGSDGKEWRILGPSDDLIWFGEKGWATTTDGSVRFTDVRFG